MPMIKALKIALASGLLLSVCGFVESRLTGNRVVADVCLLIAFGGFLVALNACVFMLELREPKIAAPSIGKYLVRDVASEAEWRTLFALVRFPHMTQTWAFGEAKRSTNWKPRRLVIVRDGEPVGICQMLYKMVRGLSVVARINQGPLMLEGHGDKELAAHLAIRKRFRFRCALMISPAVSRTDDSAIALKGIGFRRIGSFNWASSRVDLTRADMDLRKALDAKWRNQLNKAEKNGLQFIADNDVQWILQTHIRNMAEKGFEGPAPSLLRALHETSPADFLVFKAVHEGAPVAGMVAYRFGDVAHYYIGWFGPEGRKISAGNFLLWNAALELKRLGVRQFDLGGHNNKFGFGGFKMGMNGVGYQCAGEFLSL